MDTDAVLTNKLLTVLPYLDEKQRRLVLAAEARSLGYGGISQVARVSGVSRPTLYQGLQEPLVGQQDPQMVRRAGGGRKRITELDPTLLEDLERLVEPDSRGAPMSALRWTCKSTRQLAAVLNQQGHHVSHQRVAQLLRESGYSLQSNVKPVEGKQHPERDAQFCYLNEQIKQ